LAHGSSQASSFLKQHQLKSQNQFISRQHNTTYELYKQQVKETEIQ